MYKNMLCYTCCLGSPWRHEHSTVEAYGYNQAEFSDIMNTVVEIHALVILIVWVVAGQDGGSRTCPYNYCPVLNQQSSCCGSHNTVSASCLWCAGYLHIQSMCCVEPEHLAQSLSMKTRKGENPGVHWCAGLGNLISDIAGIFMADSIESRARVWKFGRMPQLSAIQRQSNTVFCTPLLATVCPRISIP